MLKRIFERASCSRILRKLAQGTSDIPASGPEAHHINTCPGCSTAARQFAQVDSGLRSLSLGSNDAGEGSARLSQVSRARLLREVRSSFAASGRSQSAAGWVVAASRIPAFATLVAAFLIVGFAYFRTSSPVQDFSPKAAIPQGPSDLKVSQKGSDIVLEWTDGLRDSYVVRQASSARAVYTAPGVEVKGHRYVDRSPSDTAVVYYLVE